METQVIEYEIEFFPESKKFKSSPDPIGESFPVKSKKLQPYHCPICKFTISDNVPWRTHLKINHPNRSSVGNIKQLDMIEEMKKNKDKYLKDETAYKKKLQQLVIVDPKDFSVTCSICRNKFLVKYKAIRHVELTHLDIKKYPCQFCEKIFGDESKYSAHKSLVHLEDMKIQAKEKYQQSTAVN